MGITQIRVSRAAGSDMYACIAKSLKHPCLELCVYFVTTYYVSEEKAPVVVKSPPVPGATWGNGMQPGGWPTLLQLWKGNAIGYKSVDLTAEGAGLRLTPMKWGHNRPPLSVYSDRTLVIYNLLHSCTFTEGTRD